MVVLVLVFGGGDGGDGGGGGWWRWLSAGMLVMELKEMIVYDADPQKPPPVA